MLVYTVELPRGIICWCVIVKFGQSNIGVRRGKLSNRVRAISIVSMCRSSLGLGIFLCNLVYNNVEGAITLLQNFVRHANL